MRRQNIDADSDSSDAATQQRSALCGGAIHQKDAQAKKNYEMAIIIVGTHTRTHASLSLALSHCSTQLKVTQLQLSTAAALLATLLGVALVLSSSSGAGFVLLLLLLLLLSLALRVVCAVHEAATSPSTSSSPSQFILERFNGNRLDICNSLSDADVAVASLLCLLTQPAHHTHAHTHMCVPTWGWQ